MKKGILFLIASVFMINANAGCGYEEFVHISQYANPALYIGEYSSDRNVEYLYMGTRSFKIVDKTCIDGYVHVAIGYDSNHWCRLDIKDGPRMSDPEVVNYSCSGMLFKDLVEDGRYSYVINFY